MKRRSLSMEMALEENCSEDALKRQRIDPPSVEATPEHPPIQCDPVLMVRTVSQINRESSLFDSSPEPQNALPADESSADPIPEVNDGEPENNVIQGVIGNANGISSETRQRHDPPPEAEEHTEGLNTTDNAALERESISIKHEIKTEIKTEINDEPIDLTNQPSTSTGKQTSDSKPVMVKSESVQTTPVTVSLRASCNFGIRCYLRRPEHRNDMAHPGDPDYRRPYCPPSLPAAPPCPFGARCYRRNPEHFLHFRHPPHDQYNPDINGGPMPVPSPYPPPTRPPATTYATSMNHHQHPRRHRDNPVYVLPAYLSDADFSSGDEIDPFDPAFDDDWWS